MQKFTMYTGFVMGAIFLIVGTMLIVSPPEGFNLPISPAVLGVIVVAYGLLRLTRAWFQLKATRRDAARERLDNQQPPQ